MRSINGWLPWLFALCLSASGCGGTSSGGAGGSGGAAGDSGECVPALVDAEETCSDFCATAVGECNAFTFDEERCRQGCEINVAEGYGCSEDCGTALEAMFQCVAERDDCEDVYGWRDRTDDHACRGAVVDVGLVCPF